MKNWFNWCGESSLDYGIEVIRQPEIVIAQERVTSEKVAGRSGTVTLLDGEYVYDDITLSADCMIADLTRLQEAMFWLQGPGKLEFPARPGGHYIGRLSGQISLAKILAVRENRRFTLTWRCEPFFYLTEGDDIELTVPGAVQNMGTMPALPKISVYGSGDVNLTVGGVVMQLTDLTDGIVIDSELVDALDLAEMQLMNEHMTGEFPVLGRGYTSVSWNGNGGSVTKVVIRPRWRSL